MTIPVSVGKLASLAHPAACPRCFWLSIKAPRKPYEIHAGILAKTDAFIKATVGHTLQAEGRLPSWIPWNASKKAATPGRWDKEVGGLLVRGFPDDVFYLVEGGHGIPDYKSGTYKPGSPWHNVYEAQVRIYAAISPEWCDPKKLGICYLQPQTRVNPAVNDDPALLFDPHTVEVERDDEVLGHLASWAEGLLVGLLPAPRNGCEDCEALSAHAGFIA